MRRAQDRARGPEGTERDDRIARPRRAQTCELRAKRAMRMCPRSGQIFSIIFEKFHHLCIGKLRFFLQCTDLSSKMCVLFKIQKENPCLKALCYVTLVEIR